MIWNFIKLSGNQHLKIIEILPSMKGSPDEEEENTQEEEEGVTIGPFIWLYLWVIVTRVDKIVVVVRSGGCRCLGNHVLLQVRVTIV